MSGTPTKTPSTPTKEKGTTPSKQGKGGSKTPKGPPPPDPNQPGMRAFITSSRPVAAAPPQPVEWSTYTPVANEQRSRLPIDHLDVARREQAACLVDTLDFSASQETPQGSSSLWDSRVDRWKSLPLLPTPKRPQVPLSGEVGLPPGFDVTHKLIHFHDNHRLVYYGTHQRRAVLLDGRFPVGSAPPQDPTIDYNEEDDFESDSEGESLANDKESEDDDEDDGHDLLDDNVGDDDDGVEKEGRRREAGRRKKAQLDWATLSAGPPCVISLDCHNPDPFTGDLWILIGLRERGRNGEEVLQKVRRPRKTDRGEEEPVGPKQKAQKRSKSSGVAAAAAAPVDEPSPSRKKRKVKVGGSSSSSGGGTTSSGGGGDEGKAKSSNWLLSKLQSPNRAAAGTVSPPPLPPSSSSSSSSSSSVQPIEKTEELQADGSKIALPPGCVNKETLSPAAPGGLPHGNTEKVTPTALPPSLSLPVQPSSSSSSSSSSSNTIETDSPTPTAESSVLVEPWISVPSLSDGDDIS